MLNKRDYLLHNFYFQQRAILFLHFFNFIPFLLLIPFFPLRFFRFNFVVSERNVHVLFCRHIWAELSLLFWIFLSGTFFQVAGGVHVHPVHSPWVRAWYGKKWLRFSKRRWTVEKGSAKSLSEGNFDEPTAVCTSQRLEMHPLWTVKAVTCVTVLLPLPLSWHICISSFF